MCLALPYKDKNDDDISSVKSSSFSFSTLSPSLSLSLLSPTREASTMMMERKSFACPNHSHRLKRQHLCQKFLLKKD